MRYCDYCEYPTHRADDCPFLADEIEQLIDEPEIEEELARKQADKD